MIMFEQIKKVAVCLLAIFFGLLIGRQLRSHYFASPRQVEVIPSYHPGGGASVVESRPIVRRDYSYKRLTLSQIMSEVDKPGYPDDRYMISQWFAGRGELLAEAKKSLAVATKGLSVDSGLSHFTLSDDFHEAVSDEDKRRIFHEYTRARLYNMLMLLEVAKRRDLIPKTNHPATTELGAETRNISR
jgi:hypothetical protein